MQFILSSIMLSLLFAQTATQKKSDRDLAHLAGIASSVSVQQASMKEESGKWVEGNREAVSGTAFDEAGRMKEFTFNPNSRTSIKREFVYDAEGNRQEKLFQYRVVDEATNKCELIGEPRLFNVVLKFDAEGNRVGEDKFAASGNGVEKKVYKFDTENNADELAIYGNDNAFLSRCVEVYDKQDRPFEKVCYNEEGAILARESYDVKEFDSKGNWVKRIETIWQMKDGKPVAIGKLVSYRTILYYPPGATLARGETPKREVAGSETAKSNLPKSETAKTETVQPATEQKIEQPPVSATPAMAGETVGPKAVKKAEPVYPAFARNANVSGTVVVEVVIDEKGKVTRADAVSGPLQLRQAAADAAKRWEYQPATTNGKPVQSTTRITFNFTR
jgi:TonB family protein